MATDVKICPRKRISESDSGDEFRRFESRGHKQIGDHMADEVPIFNSHHVGGLKPMRATHKPKAEVWRLPFPEPQFVSRFEKVPLNKGAYQMPLKNFMKQFLLRMVLVCCTLLARDLTGAQRVYSYDSSGNTTNVASTANLPPTASTATNALVLYSGESLSLSFSEVGTPPVSFQWRRNGSSLTGYTGATLYIPAVLESDSGVYSLVISNAFGKVTNQIASLSVLPTKQPLWSVTYGGSRYVAVGDGGKIVSSTDLSTWGTMSSGTSNRLEGVFYGNGLFVAVGTKGTILTSADGVSWSSQTSGNTNDLKSVAYGNGTYVAVGGRGTILTSTNALNWITRTFDNVNLRATTYGNGKFLAVGTSGSIWVSTNNGLGWNDYSWPTAQTLNATLYASGKYIVAGDDGIILVSTNAVNWAQSQSSTSSSFTSLAYVNSTYYAFGPLRSMFVSTDAIRWGIAPLASFDKFASAVAVGGNLVAVGDRGNIRNVIYGVVDHYGISSIPTAQRAGQAFNVTFSAKDAADGSLSGFSGTLGLSGTRLLPSVTTNLFGNISPTWQTVGTNTYGYSFTPDKDIVVTHFRTYFGKQVSIWSSAGEPIVSVPITNAPASWTLTPLVPGLRLSAGLTYVVGVYSDILAYYRLDGGSVFADGTLDQGLVAPGANGIPWQGYSARWPLVDMQYTVERTQTVVLSPSSTVLSNGVATVSVVLTNAVRGVVLKSLDSQGRVGLSNPFNVYASNDLAIAMSASRRPASPTESFYYTLTVQNPSGNSATGVLVTNYLPANVTNVVATSTKGTTSVSNGKVIGNIGTMLAGTAETITITVQPTLAGVVLTNIATASKNEADSDLSNNSATEITEVMPLLTVSGGFTTEGNLGSRQVNVQISVNPPTPYAIWFDLTTSDGTAIAGSDYKQEIQTQILIYPGQSVWSFPLEIYGDTVGEADEVFHVNFSNVRGAVISTNQINISIVNDDDVANTIDFFRWDTVYTPQRIDAPIAATVRALDYFTNSVTGFTSNSLLRAVPIGGAGSKTLLTNALPTRSGNDGTYTFGYSFRPSTNIFVTHLRQYSGTKAELWSDSGHLLASVSLTAKGGQWTETQLNNPVMLRQGEVYRVGVFTGGSEYYSTPEAPLRFVNGTILGSFYALGDAFPASMDNSAWYMVDLTYSLAANIAPTNTTTFTNGVWTGGISVKDTGTFKLMADDGNGHIGYSNPFLVFATNDLSLYVKTSTTLPLVGSNLNYEVVIVNPGPSTSTSVRLTNTMPANVTFVGVSASTGTTSTNGRTVSWDIGSLSGLASATMTLTVKPDVAGVTITNTASVYRNESDPNPSNNTAISILSAGYAMSLLYTEGLENDEVWRSWASGGAIWMLQTNVTHDGIDALQSGPISHGQSSFVESGVRGPGTLKFWWKVSSEQNGDRFYFYTNGFSMAYITGEQGWQQFSYSVPTSYVAVTWGYVKDGNISAGSDCAWLDQIEYTIPGFQFVSPPILTNGTTRLNIAGTNGQRLILQASQDLKSWVSLSTNIVTGGAISVIDTSSTNYQNRAYRAIHRNEP